MSEAFDIKDIIETVRVVSANSSINIVENSSIFTDLDLDSMKILELVHQLKEQYGIDFLSLSSPLDNLKSPRTIYETIAKMQSG